MYGILRLIGDHQTLRGSIQNTGMVFLRSVKETLVLYPQIVFIFQKLIGVSSSWKY